MRFEALLRPRVAWLSLASLLLVAGACEAKSGTNKPTPMPAPTATSFDVAAGGRNLELGESGKGIACIGATLVREGGRIVITSMVSPSETQGVVTHYQLYSSNEPVEGQFSGTTGLVDAEVSEQGVGFIRIAYPYGRQTKTADCSSRALPIKG